MSKYDKPTIAVVVIVTIAIGVALFAGFNVIEQDMQTNNGPTSCQYNGVTYESSESFNAADGCNQCVCADGEVICTEIDCKSEENDSYLVEHNGVIEEKEITIGSSIFTFNNYFESEELGFSFFYPDDFEIEGEPKEDFLRLIKTDLTEDGDTYVKYSLEISITEDIFTEEDVFTRAYKITDITEELPIVEVDNQEIIPIKGSNREGVPCDFEDPNQGYRNFITNLYHYPLYEDIVAIIRIDGGYNDCFGNIPDAASLEEAIEQQLQTDDILKQFGILNTITKI